MSDRMVHAQDLDSTRGLAEDGSKAFVKVDGKTLKFNVTGQLYATGEMTVEITDTTDPTYYYYGGNVDGAWEIRRFDKSNPSDPLYLKRMAANQANNAAYTNLIGAWVDRASLTYA